MVKLRVKSWGLVLGYVFGVKVRVRVKEYGWKLGLSWVRVRVWVRFRFFGGEEPEHILTSHSIDGLLRTEVYGICR
jgi:hypothetical protein